MRKFLLILIFIISNTLLPLYAREVSTEQKIAGLYVAFFNRAPDMNGLNYWKSRTDTILAQGENPMVVFKEISKGFSTHPVFTSTYNSLNNEEFVKAIYINALGREGDSEGISYWTTALTNGLSRPDMVAIFVNASLTVDLTPQNFPTLSQSELDAAKLRQDLITNKTQVALEFINQLQDKTNITNLDDIENDSAYKASIKILSVVTDDRTTVDSTKEYINTIKEQTNPIDKIVSEWGGKYPLHINIITTTFWVGEESDIDNNFIPNKVSAWDDNWLNDYGGVDDPYNRNNYYPFLFTALENPFYYALPYNDYDENGTRKDGLSSTPILKNRWIKIIKEDNIAFAQWEDVGPINSDDNDYVFGYAKPSSEFNNHAGLDVSPAVRDYLNLNGEEMTNWQFVDEEDVPDGPWKQIVTTSQINWTDWYKPDIHATWQWQLTGDINTSYNVDIYDIDLFEADETLIQELKNRSKKVICYFSAGSYEEWSSDADKFPKNIIGNDLDGWIGEKWLDIRESSIKPIMLSRLDLAQQKGCDGVEPDNVDGYTNNTSFPLSSEDQLLYNKFIANEAHRRGLSVGLKNDLEQISILEPFFDFAINEQCHIYDECGYMQPFTNANKSVLNVEYAQKYIDNKNNAKDELCSDANSRDFYTLILPMDLDDSFRYGCK